MIKLIGKRILAVILSGAILMSNMSAYAAELSGGTAKECREASENEDTSIEVTEKSEETFGSAAASENLDAENSMQNGEDAENGNGNETQAVEESAADGTEAETKIKSEVESEIKMESEEESESGTKIESEEESESETKIESETESESETEAESEGILSQSTTAARASSKNSSSKDSVNQYMADAFLRDSCWINKDEVQGIPEAFYYAGELQDNYIWQNMESLWKAIEAADGNPNLNLSPKTLYQAALMDILAEQVQLEKDLNSYSIEGDSIVTVMENISSGSDESKVIEETQKFIDLSAKGAAAAPMGEWISTNHNQIFKELSDVKVSIILASAQSTVSTGDEMYDYFIKVGELVQINDSMITALEDMYNHVDAAFSSNYKGTSVQKAAEKKIIQEAILEMINILKGDEFQEKLVGEADICIREGTSLGYNISISLLWDELGNINPEFQAVKWGLDNGINLSNLLFNIDNKIKDAAIANVRCKLHRIIQSGVKRSRQGYKSSRSDANAELFVNYVYLLSDSYRVMLDTIHDYAKSTGIIKRFYLEEINASSLKFAGAFFESLVHVPIFNEDEEYKKYERSWLSKVTNAKAIPLNEIYNLYVKGLEQYVEQQKARKTAIKQIYTGISSSETADEQAKQTASEALELFETFVTYPSVTAPSESKIAEDEAKSKKHQLTYADQVISSGKTLDEDMMTYGNMTFSGGVLDLNGHTLAIYGDFYHTGGQIRFNKGTLIILGKYYCRKQSGVDNDGNSTYTSSSGTLRMTDATDKMQVSGDFYWRSNSLWTTDINASTSNNMLRAGTIEIGGNFQADDNWKPSTLEGDSHKEVFKNLEGTEVYFKWSSSYFSNVEFPEKAEGKDYYPITWSGAMKGFTLQQDMYLILPESKYPEGYQTLGTDGSINLNGHTLTIPGNVLHIGGNITFRGGTLDIRGNYEAKQFKNLDNNGNPIYTSSSCTLRMADAADKMQVAGDFYWDSHSGWTTDINASTSYNMLRAGTIEIGGSFRTDSSWKPSTLAGDSNTVWLKGNTAKTISMPSSSKFNILKLDRDVDSYSITPNPCWAVLLTGGKYHVQPAASVSIKNTVITNKADGTVTVKNTKVTPNVDITLKLPQKNMELVVSQTGEITIPSNTELTMPARKDKITLPEGGTASASGTVKSGCLVVGDLRIDAQENAAINVSAQGEITLPKDTILTGSDGTKTKLPQGGTITADGELTGDKKPDDEESSGSEESGGSEESDSDEDEWHYPNEIIVSAEAKVRDLKTDAKAEIATNIKEKVYDGNAYTPTVKVTAYDENGKKTTLTEGVDYRVKYRNNVNAGDAVVVIEGNGAYKGSIQKGFRISKKPINKIKIVSGAMIEGNTVSLDRLPIQVCDGAKQLKYGTDYTLAVSNAAEGSSVTKGTLTVTVTAGSDSNYTGICTEKITVFGKPSKNFKGFITSPDDVILEYESTGYTGKPLKPAVKEIRARDEQNNLQESPLGKKDFSVKYQNNKETGTAYVIITGKGGYVGRVIKSFTIVPKNAGNTAFVIKNQAKIDKGVTYNGKLQKPKVTVTDSSTNKTLKLGKDYTVRYANNLHASDTETNRGKAKIIIRGIGAYSGISLTREFKILPIDIKKASVKGTSEQLNITHAKRLLVKNYDYKIAGDPKPTGKKVEITLEGVGDFKGTVTKKVNP